MDFTGLCYNVPVVCRNVRSCSGGIHGTVVARWTTGQQVERSILHQEHDSSQKIILLVQVVPWPSIGLQVQNHGLKHHSFHLINPSCPWPSIAFTSAAPWPKTPFISCVALGGMLQ